MESVTGKWLSEHPGVALEESIVGIGSPGTKLPYIKQLLEDLSLRKVVRLAQTMSHRGIAEMTIARHKPGFCSGSFIPCNAELHFRSWSMFM